MRRLTIGLFVVLSALLSADASAQQVVSTYSAGALGDPFNSPQYLTLDKAGNLFVSDTGNHRVQRIDRQTGSISTIAGTGAAGYSGDGGRATLAQLGCPMGLAFDSLGNLYIADRCQNAVRKVAPGTDLAVTGAADEIITTFAGNGTTSGTCVLTDGVPANQTSVTGPFQVAIDQADNVFIIAFSCGEHIRRVDAASGLISTTNYLVYGNPNDSMVFDNAGNLLISENAVASCSPVSGNLLTGNENCSTVLYGETNPGPQAVDGAGNLYFIDDPCDGGGGCFAIYKATPGSDGTLRSGTFTLYAGGTGGRGYTGDGGPPLDATFNNPRGLAIDSAGNLFIADTGNNVIRVVSSGPTPPSLTGFPANPSNQSSPTFSFGADASVTSFECTLDQLTSPCTSPVTYHNLADGSHTFSVIGRSSSGTPSNVTSYTWVVDTVPPPVPSIDSHPSDPSATAFAGFTFTESETGTRLTCSLDGSATSCSSPILYPALPDGSHVFSVMATDAAGNNSAPNSFTWTIHTVTPPAPHIDSGPAALTNSKVSTLVFSDAQAGVSFLCRLDTQAQTPCVSPITYIGLPDGVHTFSVVASDAVAGRSSAASTYTWTMDTTPPKVGINGAPGSVIPPAVSNVYFSGTSDAVGFLCSLDGAAFSPCTSPFSTSITAVGDHSLSVEAVDAAGNISDPAVAGWQVTYCRCAVPGNYTLPAMNTTFITQQSPGGAFKVSAVVDPTTQLVTVSLIRGDGTVAYSIGSGNGVPAWQFSPDGSTFLFHTLNASSGQDQITVVDLTQSTPRAILSTSITTSSATFVYSPSGAYLLSVAIEPNGTQTAVRIWRVVGVSQAVLVHSGDFFGHGIEGVEGTASWGFSQNTVGDEAAFLYSWVTGPNTFSWNVVNLARGTQTISQSSTAQSAFWMFNPCGTIIAFVNQSSANEEQVDLFSTEVGTHIGETSFPLQDFTLFSSPFQEIATITNPPQQIVVANDPTCTPNTPAGNNVGAIPVDAANNTSPVTVTFSTVTQAGGTAVTSSSTGNAPPGGFEIGDPPRYFDITTSASYSGQIVVCFSYAGITFNGQPRLFHFVNGAWVDVTTSVDTTHQIICGTVTSLSPFAIFGAPTNRPPTVQTGPPQTVEATSPAGALVTLTGSATDPDNDPLTLTWREGVNVLGSGAQISTTLALGSHIVSLTADDGHGGTATATAIVSVRDTTPPKVTAPASITIPATEAGGARGNAWPALAAFLAGGAAKDLVDVSPAALAPQAGGVNVDNSTLFPCGTSQVTFRFKDASGNIGSAIASVTVVVGSPKISGEIAGRGTLTGGSMFLDLKLTNTGTGNARKLAVDLVLAVPLKGQGFIKTVSPVKPIVIGNLDAGSTETIRVVLTVPPSVKQFLLTAGGTLFNVQGKLDVFAVTQVLNP